MWLAIITFGFLIGRLSSVEMYSLFLISCNKQRQKTINNSHDALINHRMRGVINPLTNIWHFRHNHAPQCSMLQKSNASNRYDFTLLYYYINKDNI